MNDTRLALYDRIMRAHAHPSGLTREASEHTARYTSASGSLRFILWHHFAQELVDDIIHEEVIACSGRADSLMWKVYAHDTPSAALATALVNSGFTEDDHSSLMMMPVDQAIERLDDAPESELSVRELKSAASLDAYQEIWDSVWPDAPNARYVNDYRALAAASDPGIAFFAGFAKDEPVSSGYLFHHPGDPIVLLCGGATKSAWRGHGAYKSMLAARAHVAKARGAHYLAVEASPNSQPILKRLGFETLSTLAFYERAIGAGA